MSSISGVSGQSDYSSLFDSLNSSTSSSSSSNFLADYASIKNGSYYKLAKKYYANAEGTSSASSKDEIKETIKSNNLVSGASSSLKKAADALADSKTLFSKKETKDASGNVTSDYDRDAIGKGIQAFVDSYNDVLKNASDSDNMKVLRDALSITNSTKVHSALLSDVGITIGEDNKLSIDEDKLKEADISKLKSLFSGSGSYAYQVSARAASMTSAANSENNKLSTYNVSGGYSSANSVGNIYDGSL